MALQFETGVQNLVYQMDAGAGRRIMQAALALLFAIAMAFLYTITNFRGLKDARAMDEAQLARSYAMGEGLKTRSIRPLAIGLLRERHPEGVNLVQNHPDLLHPPLWPAILGTYFRVVGVPQPGVPNTHNVYPSDYAPVALNHFFTVLSALWVWLIGRKLFDGRVAALSVGAYLSSDLAWRNSMLGGDFGAAVFFVLGAVYSALWAADAGASGWRGWLALGASSFLTSAAFLARYGAGTIALAIFLFIGVSRRNRSWGLATVYAAVAALPAGLWAARNVAVSGSPFGLVFHELLAGTYLFPEDAIYRTVEPFLPDFGTMMFAVQIKMMNNLRTYADSGFGLAGCGLLLGLFAAMYLHRFVRPSSRLLRWCLLPSVALAALSGAAFGEESLRALAIYWPLAIPFAWAFFLVLLDRLQFELRFFAAGAISIAMFVSGLPMLLQVLPPRTGLPYPPYFHRYVGWISTMLDEGECMATDIPWAMAWYGGKTAVQLPMNIDGFYELHEKHQKLSMVYFTTVTRNKPWVRGLSDPSAPEHSWYQIFAAGKVPATFPLAHGRFIDGSDQFLLADRPRW